MAIQVIKSSSAIEITPISATETKGSRYKFSINGHTKTYGKPYSNFDEEMAELLERFYQDIDFKLPEHGFSVHSTAKGWVAVPLTA